MADDTTTKTDDDTTVDADKSTTDDTKTKDDIPPEVKRALSKANKEAETLRLKLKEFEDRDKSELEKANERAEAAERRAAENESKALRAEVASAKGVPPHRISGSTKAELEADADAYIAERDTAKKAPTAAQKLRSGATGDGQQMTDRERAAASLRDLRGTT